MKQKQTIEYKPIEKLHFDPQNPRLPSTVDEKDEQEVLKWMLEDASIIELMLSIGEKDYFPGEAILIVPHDKLEGHYYVIEGNRRLTATKLLSSPNFAPIRKNAVEQAAKEAKFRPIELPVIQFSKREDILNYLGYRHITGVKAWGALAKAKYLHQLANSLSTKNPQEQHKELAKTIGSRADYVARQLNGYRLYQQIADENFFGIKDLNEGSFAFSVFTTALNYQNIAKFIGLDNNQDQELQGLNSKHLHELTSWLFEKHSEGKTRLGESRNLQNLNSVIGHEKALERFRAGESLENAVLYTEVPAHIFQQAILEAKSRLELARNYVHLLEKPSNTDAENLFEIQKLARSLKVLIDDKLLEIEM